jgi:D-3-phosphoglycerate dehydrogenase
VTTPHIAASTSEAQERVALQVAEQIVNALRGLPVASAVNASAVASAARPEIQAYIKLAEVLGRVVAQLHTSSIQRISISCKGAVTRRFGDALLTSATSGILSERLSSPVNLVNAITLAEDAGVPLSIGYDDAPIGYTDVICVKLHSTNEIHEITGAVFAGGDLRVVELDGYHVELRLPGRFLVYRNEDKPGILAAVGAILATSDVNIGSMAIGRGEQTPTAITAMMIDQSVSEEALDRLRSIGGIDSINLVSV